MTDSGNFPALSLVLGGARSGKSAFAERLVEVADRPKTYIATGQAFDDEMKARILQHQIDRGENWNTIEAPLDIVRALSFVSEGSVVLVDCLTLWLSNQMLNENDVDQEISSLLEALANSENPVVCVSNEVGMGLVPENTMGRKFRDLQGKLNREVASIANLAVFVAAGLPLTLKGETPKGLL